MKYNMKYKFWDYILIGVVVIGSILLVETGLKEVSFLLMLWLAPLVEEGFKVGGLLIFKPSAKSYYLTVALLFTLIEFFGNYSVGASFWWMGLRLVPHFLFAVVFLWGMRKSVRFGFLSALITHATWNTLLTLI